MHRMIFFAAMLFFTLARAADDTPKEFQLTRQADFMPWSQLYSYRGGHGKDGTLQEAGKGYITATVGVSEDSSGGYVPFVRCSKISGSQAPQPIEVERKDLRPLNGGCELPGIEGPLFIYRVKDVSEDFATVERGGEQREIRRNVWVHYRGADKNDLKVGDYVAVTPSSFGNIFGSSDPEAVIIKDFSKPQS